MTIPSHEGIWVTRPAILKKKKKKKRCALLHSIGLDVPKVFLQVSMDACVKRLRTCVTVKGNNVSFFFLFCSLLTAQVERPSYLPRFYVLRRHKVFKHLLRPVYYLA